MPKHFLTDEDIKLLHEIFPTKDDLRDMVEVIVKDHVGGLPTKTEFYTAMDALMTEIKSMREEFSVITGYKDNIEDHEARLAMVEKKLTASAN